MSAPNGKLYEARSELRVWANATDMVLRRAPGSTLRDWLDGRTIEALDLDEIEGFCRVASAQYHVLIRTWYVHNGAARTDRQPMRGFERRSRAEPIMFHDERDMDERSG